MIEISGTVVDITTGDGIPSATIAVNGKAVAAADASGNFSVSVDSYNDSLTASSVGYTSLTQQAFQVQESGLLQLGIDASSLEAATVTATAKKKISPWWLLAGIAVVASTSKPRRSTSMGASRTKGSNLIPIAALGIGAYLLLKPKPAVYSPSPGTTSYPYPAPSGSGNTSIWSPGNLSSIYDIAKDLFGSWNTSSANENTSSGNYTSYDPSGGGNMAGTAMGATTTVNAGDIIGHTLIAAMRVPVYDQANDSGQPSGYISAGQPIGQVFSYLNADPSQGRSELWWMFEPLPGVSEIGDSLGYYYTPHNPDYFDFQALADSGVLTVAQATALKNGTAPSTLEKLVDKYVPWIIGGIIAVGIGKAIINKAL